VEWAESAKDSPGILAIAGSYHSAPEVHCEAKSGDLCATIHNGSIYIIHSKNVMCLYTYIHIYIYTCIHVYMYTRIYVYNVYLIVSDIYI